MNFHCFLELIKRELYLFFKEFWSRFINIAVVVSTNLIVFGYLMNMTGFQVSYGEFIFVGSIACFGLFETIAKATYLAQDVSDLKISNFLTLPISSKNVFIAIAFSWAASITILALLLIPLGKLLLWHAFDFSHISIFKFSLIFLCGNIFYGFFALWISSLVVDLRNTGWLWTRVINPLFMFCGFFYSWQTAYDFSHLVGYLHLLNPMIFIIEGNKAAIFGQQGFLPFWVCFFVIVGYILLFAFDAIRRFKKRLDWV